MTLMQWLSCLMSIPTGAVSVARQIISVNGGMV
jgi:hypothetical protein